MDSKTFNAFGTYLDVYKFLSKGSYTQSELEKMLEMQNRSSTSSHNHADKAAKGELRFISQNADKKLILDKEAMIPFWEDFFRELNLEAEIHVKKKENPEAKIVALKKAHSSDYTNLKRERNAALNQVKKLEKQISDLKKRRGKKLEKDILDAEGRKVMVLSSVRASIPQKFEDDFFLATAESLLDPTQLISKSGGVMASMFTLDESPEKELTEQNYLQRIFNHFQSGLFFRKRLEDEEKLDEKDVDVKELDSNRIASINSLLANKTLTNQAKLTAYAYWYLHDDPEMEDLLRMAGQYDINAEYVIQLLEKPNEYRNYQTIRRMLQQARMPSEAHIKREVVEELLCGDWYVIANYGGKDCHFKLMPVEEIQRFIDLIKESRVIEAEQILNDLMKWRSTCGQSDHKLEDSSDIEVPDFVKGTEADGDVHASIDEDAALNDFEEKEGNANE